MADRKYMYELSMEKNDTVALQLEFFLMEAGHTNIHIDIGKLKSPVCSLLSCSRYWDTGQVDESQWKMLAKTFITVILFGFMIIYYFLAFHHFYAEPLFEDPSLSYNHRHNNPLLRRPPGKPPGKRKRKHKVSQR